MTKSKQGTTLAYVGATLVPMAVPICNFEWHIDWRTLAGILPNTEKE